MANINNGNSIGSRTLMTQMAVRDCISGVQGGVNQKATCRPLFLFMPDYQKHMDRAPRTL